MKIELISPLSDDAPVARFLARRGPGVHHITLKAFVRPRSGLGTLLQLADTTVRWDEPPASGITLDDVLAGRVVFTDDEQAVLREG
jgi:methylmalonyl-CoA/ethylmalonyl-CoA epimerase